MVVETSLFDAPGGHWVRRIGLAFLLGLALNASAQAPAIPTIEPGLEQAVKWRWQPEASESAVWGLSLQPEPTAENGSPSNNGISSMSRPQGPPEKTLEYTVEKGDSLYVIAKRFGVSVDQLKEFNEQKRDIINIGQVLRIPSLADLQALAPPPPPAAPKVRVNPSAPPKAEEPPAPKNLLRRPLPSAANSVARVVLMQAYLDRQGFSAGPIDGTDGPLYDAALRSFEIANPNALKSDMGQIPAALRDMGGAYTEYQLRREDLRWISPDLTPVRKSRTGENEEPEVTLEKLTSSTFLPYRSVWEFVAERYHCSESFLKRINSGLKFPNNIGAIFIVPNVMPFELENALTEPLQPTADPAAPVTATIVNNTRLEIRRSGKLIANLPISVARPGLRGRGIWKILQAIPRPQLTTLGDASAPLASPLTLPPGPNNPVGPIWIHLAKKNDTAPLPYGLHGTSIPGYMRKQESLGGFRMTNWNIALAVRLLPVETPLTWE